MKNYNKDAVAELSYLDKRCGAVQIHIADLNANTLPETPVDDVANLMAQTAGTGKRDGDHDSRYSLFYFRCSPGCENL